MALWRQKDPLGYMQHSNCRSESSNAGRRILSVETKKYKSSYNNLIVIYKRFLYPVLKKQ